VVAGSHYINSGGQQVFSDSRRNRETSGGVFDIRDYEINFVFRAQIEQPFFEHAPTSASHRVTGQQNSEHLLNAFLSRLIQLSRRGRSRKRENQPSRRADSEMILIDDEAGRARGLLREDFRSAVAGLHLNLPLTGG
jgi:hypothetical protein